MIHTVKSALLLNAITTIRRTSRYVYILYLIVQNVEITLKHQAMNNDREYKNQIKSQSRR